MGRRKRAQLREVLPDPRFGDVLLSKFINKVMLRGKKSTAQRLVYGALDEIRRRLPDHDPLEVFKKAVENCKPVIEVRSRRVGGATYQVPVDVRPVRRVSLAMRWIVQAARERHDKNFSLRLAAEILDAFNNRGGAIKKKEDVHRMAEANRAFSHLNW